MSTINISSLQRITPLDLRSLLLPSSSSTTTTITPSDKIAIIDVRDSDHIGGHIHSSTHIPSSTLDYRAAELARTLKEKEVVVFHCMLSQQRGPGAALKYLRERERLFGKGDEEGMGQKVYVLEGGFQAWVGMGYGTDERLTERFVRDIWE